MKKLTTLLLLIIISSSILITFGCSNNKEEEETDLKKENLNGPVSSVSFRQYSVVDKFGELIKGKSKIMKNGWESIITDYKRDGKIVFIKNSIFGMMVNEWFFYDKNNHLIRIDYMNSDSVKSRSRNYIYNKENVLIEINDFYVESLKTVLVKKLSYNKLGQRVKEINFSNGNITDKTTFEFDEYGNEIKLQYFDSLGAKSGYTINDYSIDGCLQSFIVISKENDTLGVYKYTYDDFNNLSKVIIELPSLKKGTEISFKYQYDKENNWVEKIMYQDGKAISINERVITYENYFFQDIETSLENN
jgi:hypothetical protein